MLNLNPPKRKTATGAQPTFSKDAKKLQILQYLNVKPRTLKEIQKHVGYYHINVCMAELASARAIVYNQTDRKYELYNMELL